MSPAAVIVFRCRASLPGTAAAQPQRRQHRLQADHEREIQAASGDADWEAKAKAALPFGRLVDPAEAARAVNFLVSDDAGLMTGAIVNFDQSVWGAVAGGMPVPEAPMRLA